MELRDGGEAQERRGLHRRGEHHQGLQEEVLHQRPEQKEEAEQGEEVVAEPDEANSQTEQDLGQHRLRDCRLEEGSAEEQSLAQLPHSKDPRLEHEKERRRVRVEETRKRPLLDFGAGRAVLLLERVNQPGRRLGAKERTGGHCVPQYLQVFAKRVESAAHAVGVDRPARLLAELAERCAQLHPHQLRQQRVLLLHLAIAVAAAAVGSLLELLHWLAHREVAFFKEERPRVAPDQETPAERRVQEDLGETE